MLSKNPLYCIISLLAIIFLLTDAAIAIDNKQSVTFPALSNNIKENMSSSDPEMESDHNTSAQKKSDSK